MAGLLIDAAGTLELLDGRGCGRAGAAAGAARASGTESQLDGSPAPLRENVSILSPVYTRRTDTVYTVTL